MSSRISRWNLSSLAMAASRASSRRAICSRWTRSMVRVNSTRQPFSTRAKPSAAARWLLPPPGGPNNSKLAPLFNQASPAASAMTCALLITGRATFAFATRSQAHPATAPAGKQPEQAGGDEMSEAWVAGSRIGDRAWACVAQRPALSEMRHDFLGKQPHRLLHKRGVYQPSLVEVEDELVKTILGLQLPNPRDAIFRVAEHAHLAIHISKGDALHAGPHLGPTN